jgi:hypothetical protein
MQAPPTSTARLFLQPHKASADIPPTAFVPALINATASYQAIKIAGLLFNLLGTSQTVRWQRRLFSNHHRIQSPTTVPVRILIGIGRSDRLVTILRP